MRLYVEIEGYKCARLFKKVRTKQGKIKKVYMGSLGFELIERMRRGERVRYHLENEAWLDTLLRTKVLKVRDRAKAGSKNLG